MDAQVTKLRAGELPVSIAERHNPDFYVEETNAGRAAREVGALRPVEMERVKNEFHSPQLLREDALWRLIQATQSCG